MNHKRFLVIAILFWSSYKSTENPPKKSFSAGTAMSKSIPGSPHDSGRVESRTVPNGNAGHPHASHALANSYTHDCQSRFRSVPPCNGLYREANCPYYSESRSTFFQVHIAIHHKSAIKNFVGCHGSLAALVKKLQDNAILSFNDIFNIWAAVYFTIKQFDFRRLLPS
mgnify:CR=1 FL=1